MNLLSLSQPEYGQMFLDNCVLNFCFTDKYFKYFAQKIYTFFKFKYFKYFRGTHYSINKIFMNHISKATFSFLKDIQKNNNREWFTEHKPKYVAAQTEIKAFAQDVLELLSQHDNIEGPKVFRIYRDVRFSKDKTPYKTNIGVGFSRATEALRGGMYINIEPNNTFVGGGFWNPNSPDLKRIRNELSVNAGEFRTIITSKSFKDNFGELKGEALKTAPRGFAKDHPDLDLIRMKQFLVGKDFTNKQALSKDFAHQINETFRAMRPFFDFMSDVLTTNENGESIL